MRDMEDGYFDRRRIVNYFANCSKQDQIRIDSGTRMISSMLMSNTNAMQIGHRSVIPTSGTMYTSSLPSSPQSKVSGLIGMTNTSVIRMLSALAKAATANDNVITPESMLVSYLKNINKPQVLLILSLHLLSVYTIELVSSIFPREKRKSSVDFFEIVAGNRSREHEESSR